jgi:hypothetical protein
MVSHLLYTGTFKTDIHNTSRLVEGGRLETIQERNILVSRLFCFRSALDLLSATVYPRGSSPDSSPYGAALLAIPFGGLVRKMLLRASRSP